MDMQETLTVATQLRDVLKETEESLNNIYSLLADPRVDNMLNGEQKIYSIPLDGLITQSKVEEVLHTSPASVNKLIKDGELDCVVAGSSIKKFPISSINRYIARLKKVN